ncbi:hypothetical protein Pfo_020487 [Paulownia fortunei]|nr:hypothetical protein Pfo_020487 [Paulownia fortunei]
MGENGEKIWNSQYQTWLTNDGLLTSWLLGTMTEDILSIVFGEVETAFDLWTSLEQQLLPVTIEKEGNLKNLLMVIRKGSCSLEKYLKEFKFICDNLAAIQKLIPDLDKVFQFARGLGAQYMDFHNAMLTKPPYPSFNQDCGQNRQGGRFNSRGRGFTPAERYNNNQNGVAQPNQNMNQQSNNPSRQPKLDIQQPNNSNRSDKIICQICGKTNHLAINFWHRFDYLYQSEDFPKALAALNLNDGSDPSFYVDSGATTHITNDAGKLSSLKSYTSNDMIFVGDGNALPISHVGDAYVSKKE